VEGGRREEQGDCPAPRREPLLALLGGALYLIALGVGFVAVAPPRAVPADAPAERFSAERAMRHVEAVASEVHVAGTEANARARGRIVAELQGMGLEVELQTGRVRGYDEEELRYRDIDIVNVIAEIPGPDEGGVALLACHYDSRWGSPGAADDAVGVAALLEATRAWLASGERAQRRIVLLFTDAEEWNLLGMELFTSEHPLVREVVAAANFDARGNAGPSMCFEVGPRSGALVRAWAREAPSPVGYSLAASIFAVMSNRTDFELLLDEDVPGLNFANVGGGTAYHQPWDEPGNLERGLLQQHGENALAMLRVLNTVDRRDLEGGEPATFVTLPGPSVLVTPRSWDLPLAIVAVMAALAGALRAVHKGGLRPTRVVPGLFVYGMASLVVVIGCAAAWWAAELATRGLSAAGVVEPGLPRGNGGSAALAAAGLALWGVGLAQFTLARRPRRSGFKAAVGALLAWAVCLAFSIRYAPGATHVFAIGLLLGGLGLLFASGPDPRRRRSSLLTHACGLAYVVFAVPLFRLLHQTLAIDPAQAAWEAALPLAFLLGPLVPQLGRLARAAPRLLPTLGMAGGLALLLASRLLALRGM
jgi:hypothetical protein